MGDPYPPAAGKSFGVAPGAEVRAVRVGDCDGRGKPEHAVRAVEDIARTAEIPSIMLMSLNYGDVQSVRDAVESAILKGIVVVAAAGSSLRDACTTSPGGALHVITAASIDEKDKQMTFSNYCPCVDIFAPGKNVLSADAESDRAAKVRRGSSMAAAQVAGAAALFLEDFPFARPCEVKDALIRNSLKSSVDLTKMGETSLTPNRLLPVNDVQDQER